VGAAILVIGALLVWVVLRLTPAFGRPHMRRLERFHSSLAADRRRVVVCLGDSLTQGNASFDYVHALASRLEPDGHTVLNAGINGDLAWNVLQRIDVVTRGEPAYVVLLVGTNDARAIESEWAAAKYVKSKELPQTPDEAFFRESYRGILEALAASECTRTLVVTIPPLGERSGEPIDEVVGRINRFIAEEAAARDLPCLDLHRALMAQLETGSTDEDEAVVEPPEYAAKRSQRMIVRAVLFRYLAGWRWNRIASHYDMKMLSDMVHLSDTGGAVLVDLVEQVVREKTAADC